MAPSFDRPPRPLVVLWSTPRSASTVFEKAVMQHPEIIAVHEPFTDCYYFSAERRSGRYGYVPEKAVLDRRAAYAEIERPGTSKVRFVKELAFQALPYLSDSFLRSARHLFLVHEPDTVYASLVCLKPDFTEEELGFTALFALRERVRRLKGAVPPLFTARSFRSDPEAVLRRVCDEAGLSFSADMLCWPPGPVRPWEPHEKESQSKWHVTMERSSSILPYPDRSALIQVAPAARPAVENAWRIFTALMDCDTSMGDQVRHM